MWLFWLTSTRLAVLRLNVLWLLAWRPVFAALIAAPITIMCMSTAHGDCSPTGVNAERPRGWYESFPAPQRA